MPLRSTLPLLLLCLTVGCATNAVTGKREFKFVSEDREIALGRESYIQQQQAQGGPYVTDPVLAKYVRDIGYKLVEHSDRKHLPFEFVVLNNAVPNAWALPGGKIAINRGLLTEMKSEAELAAVMGHEIVHVAAGHGADSLERGMAMQVGLFGLGFALDDHDYRDYIMTGAGVGTMLVTMKYGRGAELEADEYGIKYMAAAGYDPSAAVDLQETFLRLADGKDPDWLSGLFASHPPSRERMEKNAETSQEYPAGGYRGEKEYRNAIAGLVKAAPAYEALEKGYAALAEKNFDSALRQAETGIKIEPREAHLYGLASKALAMKKNLQKSRKAVDKAIELNPDYFEFYLIRGKLREQMGDTAGAKQDLERSNQLLPTAGAHLKLGLMAQSHGRSNEAIRHFQMAAQSESPDGVKAFSSLAQLDMPRNPARYLKIRYQLNRNRRLTVLIDNHTPVPIESCAISVYSPITKRWQTFQNRGAIPAKSTGGIPTTIGPLNTDQQLNAVRVRFQRVIPGNR